MLAKYQEGEEGMNRGERGEGCPNLLPELITVKLLLGYQCKYLAHFSTNLNRPNSLLGGGGEAKGGKRQVLGLLHRIGTKRTYIQQYLTEVDHARVADIKFCVLFFFPLLV
jgi:hypothetical protein